jgi:hypothetical protein
MTTTEAAAYLDQLGLSLPAPILAALVAKVESLDTCLAQYSDSDAALIRYYLTGLLAISSGGRRVQSQSAPSGASQSYSYGTLSEQMRQLKAALALIDTNGCTADLIPSEPGPQAAMYVVTGRRY